MVKVMVKNKKCSHCSKVCLRLRRGYCLNCYRAITGLSRGSRGSRGSGSKFQPSANKVLHLNTVLPKVSRPQIPSSSKFQPASANVPGGSNGAFSLPHCSNCLKTCFRLRRGYCLNCYRAITGLSRGNYSSKKTPPGNPLHQHSAHKFAHKLAKSSSRKVLPVKLPASISASSKFQPASANKIPGKEPAAKTPGKIPRKIQRTMIAAPSPLGRKRKNKKDKNNYFLTDKDRLVIDYAHSRIR